MTRPRFIPCLAPALAVIVLAAGAAMAQDDAVDTDAEGEASQTESTTSRTGAASNAATDAATEAIRDGDATVNSAQDEARSAAGATGVVGGTQAVLTVDGFEPEAVRRMIEESDALDRSERDRLLSEMPTAEDPETLAPYLERVRDALGS